MTGLVRTSKSNGIALIEVLVVFLLAGLLLALTIPMSINFYRKEQLSVANENLLQLLRKSQIRAMSQAESSFGVYVNEGLSQFIAFEGNSYSERVDEQVFDYPEYIDISGLNEVVFTKLTGIPVQAGSLILTMGSLALTLNINEIGRVNY